MLLPNAKPGSSRENKTGSWRTGLMPKTDNAKCIRCGICEQLCPEPCITGVEMGKKLSERTFPVTDYDYCKGCGVCAAVCPVKAITMQSEEK